MKKHLALILVASVTHITPCSSSLYGEVARTPLTQADPFSLTVTSEVNLNGEKLLAISGDASRLVTRIRDSNDSSYDGGMRSTLSGADIVLIEDLSNISHDAPASHSIAKQRIYAAKEVFGAAFSPDRSKLAISHSIRSTKPSPHESFSLAIVDISSGEVIEIPIPSAMTEMTWPTAERILFEPQYSRGGFASLNLETLQVGNATADEYQASTSIGKMRAQFQYDRTRKMTFVSERGYLTSYFFSNRATVTVAPNCAYLVYSNPLSIALLESKPEASIASWPIRFKTNIANSELVALPDSDISELRRQLSNAKGRISGGNYTLATRVYFYRPVKNPLNGKTVRANKELYIATGYIVDEPEPGVFSVAIEEGLEQIMLGDVACFGRYPNMAFKDTLAMVVSPDKK